jgi:hypothetical protein
VDAKSRVLVGPQRALQTWDAGSVGHVYFGRQQMTSDDRLLLEAALLLEGCVCTLRLPHASRLIISDNAGGA